MRRKTTAEFIEESRKVHGDRYDYSEVVYERALSKVRIKCKKHGIFEQKPSCHLSGCGCPRCALKARAEYQKLKSSRAAAEFELKAMAVHGCKYDYSEVEYTGSSSNVLIKCKDHGAFAQSPNSHLRGQGCPRCALKARAEYQKTILHKSAAKFESRAMLVHGDKYDYSEVAYEGYESKVRIRCREHGFFEQSPANHLRGSGCPMCYRDCVKTKSSKALEEHVIGFEEKARAVHGDRYDYSEVVYKGASSKVRIRCKEHGVFEQRPTSHLRGQGCFSCGNKAKGAIVFNKASAEFRSKAMKVHSGKYDYSDVVYLGNKKKVVIKCSKHGAFNQSPNSHLKGRGCPACSREAGAAIKLEIAKRCGLDFESKARAIHGYRYDYSEVSYINNHTKVRIKCKEHGVFEQTPNTHLSGGGCRCCQYSRMESTAVKLLVDIGVEFDADRRMFGSRRFDIVIPSKYQLWEFDGEQHFRPVDFWGEKMHLLD